LVESLPNLRFILKSKIDTPKAYGGVRYSKKKLVARLIESIEVKENKEFDLYSLYGAREDSRDSDEIIKEIRDSKIRKDFKY
jgi:hypothetical protein